MMSCSSLMVSS